jgi:signal transduction histidine kinase
VRFRARGSVTQHILLILLKGMRNVVQHAAAHKGHCARESRGGLVHISLDDDGTGFPSGA